VDGISATAWLAADAHATLTVELGRLVSIAKVTVHRGSRDPFPYDVELSSDGAHWKTVAHGPSTGPGGDAGTDELTFSPDQAKFLRLSFPGNNGAKPADIAEIQAFSKAD
jgi:hypothetical protein